MHVIIMEEYRVIPTCMIQTDCNNTIERLGKLDI